MMEPEALRLRLIEAFPESTVFVVDLTGTKDHFRAEITSSAFAGRSLLDQHQLVYAALGDAMNGLIHALSLKTQAP